MYQDAEPTVAPVLCVVRSLYGCVMLIAILIFVVQTGGVKHPDAETLEGDDEDDDDTETIDFANHNLRSPIAGTLSHFPLQQMRLRPHWQQQFLLNAWVYSYHPRRRRCPLSCCPQNATLRALHL